MGWYFRRRFECAMKPTGNPPPGSQSICKGNKNKRWLLKCPVPGKARVFAASSFDDEEQARQELQTWATGHGYRLAQPSRPFTIYHADHSAREWMLLEREVTRLRLNTGH